MATLYGKLKIMALLVLLLSACGNNATQTDSPPVPPPPLLNNFEGIYKVINHNDADSVLFFRIYGIEKEYHAVRYTWITKTDSLYDRGWDGLGFVNESDHRLKAQGGYASISYLQTENLLWYINKPADYKLKKVCELPEKDSFSAIKKALEKNNALPR